MIDSRLRPWFVSLVLATLLLSPRLAQGKQSDQPISALLLSDLHFDPFFDPGKVAMLADSPIDRWSAILNSPASRDQQATSASVRNRCGLAVDSPPLLLASTLDAIQSHASEISFTALTGDLLVHDFACRYSEVLPGHSKSNRDLFFEKAMLYVIQTLVQTTAGRPLYLALGNNDSLCGDYQMDRNDSLFISLEDAVMAAAQVRTRKARRDFRMYGSFSSFLPAPLQRTRMIVLNDVPFSARYKTCRGGRDPSTARDQTKWLRQQFDSARHARQKVWTIAHIPPGIYPRSSLYRSEPAKNVCVTRDPVAFLADDQLSETLADHSDVVQLSIFAHTHMDEFRVLRSKAGGDGVPVKIVPSISPIGGNRPAFLIALISRASSAMVDYTVYAATDWKDRSTNWTAEYSFRDTYNVPSFTSANLNVLIHAMQEDGDGTSAATEQYMKYYTSLEPSDYGLKNVWRGYRCVLDKSKSEDFLTCACPARGIL